MIINVNNDEMLGKTVEKELYFELYNRLKEKDKEIERLNNIIKEKTEEIEQQNKEIILLQRIFKKEMSIVNKIWLHCDSSIYSINDILSIEKITHFNKEGRCTNRNRYQIVRLKAYKTKCKEILKLIESERKE